MRLEDELLIVNEEMVPAGTGIDSVSIADRSRNIRKLIQLFNKKGIPININECEKKIKYFAGDKEKESAVPLDSRSKNYSELIGYILRGKDNYGLLEVVLSDYYETSRKGMGGGMKIVGGTVWITDGVSCRITLGGAYADNRKLNSIRSILTGFYSLNRKSEYDSLRFKIGHLKK